MDKDLSELSHWSLGQTILAFKHFHLNLTLKKINKSYIQETTQIIST